MRSTRTIALVICLCFPLQLPSQIPPGSVVDPDNDAVPSPNEDPDPDVVSASVTSDGTNLHLSVRFKAGTFDQALTGAAFALDTDQDPSTGHPGTGSNCVTDVDNIGSEFLVNMGASLGTAAQLFRFLGTCNAFAIAGAGTVTFVADGMDAVVLLARLGGEGRLNFKVTIFEQISGTNGFTGILDTMPDVGLPAAMSDGIDAPPPAEAQLLGFRFPDPVGDHTGMIDVT